MTWGELKKRCEELGIQDDDQVGIIQIDDDGRAWFAMQGAWFNKEKRERKSPTS